MRDARSISRSTCAAKHGRASCGTEQKVEIAADETPADATETRHATRC